MVNETIQLVLASTLALDGSKDDGKGWRDISAAQQRSGETTLADMFDYVCHGKIYRFEEGDGENMYVCSYLVLSGGERKRLMMVVFIGVAESISRSVVCCFI